MQNSTWRTQNSSRSREHLGKHTGRRAQSAGVHAGQARLSSADRAEPQTALGRVQQSSTRCARAQPPALRPALSYAITAYRRDGGRRRCFFALSSAQDLGESLQGEHYHS